MRHSTIWLIALAACSPSPDATPGEPNESGASPTPDPQISPSPTEDSNGTNSSSTPREVWNPAPCPKGWLRPSAGQLEFHALELNGIELPELFDLYKHYPKAHAHGNCIEVIENKIARAHLEFGPEVQGYPQSWVTLELDQGEAAYEVSVLDNKPEPELLPPYKLSYTHSFEDPNNEKPRLQSWTAGAMGSGYREVHHLKAVWVSSTPGHNLQLRNKSYIHKISEDRALTPILGLGFEITLRLPGGPLVPDARFCASLDRQKECDAFDCGTALVKWSITNEAGCEARKQRYCHLDDGLQAANLGPEPALTFYDPSDPSQFMTPSRPILKGEKDPKVPKGWKACKLGDRSPLACDCSCVNAGCRAKRMRDELDACGHPNPCPEIGKLAPNKTTQSWSTSQRCLLEKLRERSPGRYLLDIVGDGLSHDIHLFVTRKGNAIISTKGYWVDVPPSFEDDDIWQHPQICEIAAPEYFEDCLENPKATCLANQKQQFPAKSLFQNCKPLDEVDCDR